MPAYLNQTTKRGEINIMHDISSPKPQPPAEIDQSLSKIDTPALVVDLNAFERNLKTMAAKVKKANVTLRPHSKTHKALG